MSVMVIDNHCGTGPVVQDYRNRVPEALYHAPLLKHARLPETLNNRSSQLEQINKIPQGKYCPPVQHFVNPGIAQRGFCPFAICPDKLIIIHMYCV